MDERTLLNVWGKTNNAIMALGLQYAKGKTPRNVEKPDIDENVVPELQAVFAKESFQGDDIDILGWISLQFILWLYGLKQNGSGKDRPAVRTRTPDTAILNSICEKYQPELLVGLMTAVTRIDCLKEIARFKKLEIDDGAFLVEMVKIRSRLSQKHEPDKQNGNNTKQ